MILIVNHKDGTKRRIQLSPEHVWSTGRPGDKSRISFGTLMNKLKETAEYLSGENFSSIELQTND